MLLSDLFTDEDYQLKMRFHRDGIAEFFQPTAPHAALVAERRLWLAAAPKTYAALLPEGISLLAEACELALQFATVPNDSSVRDLSSNSWDQCLALGQIWEPDFLLLKADAHGAFRLYGGCVCFPSSWNLAEKMGRPLDFIHRVVPDLNQQLARQIDGFLGKIRPGISWERANWGLSRSPELNQHPERHLPRLDASVAMNEVWLRVEHQSLVALPRSEGILFGIRLDIRPLAEVKADPTAAGRLRRALATMPDEMARYKNLLAARPTLLRLLESDPHGGNL